MENGCGDWCLFNFSNNFSKDILYCYVFGFIVLYVILTYVLYYFSFCFVITSLKSMYDLIFSEIIHRDVPIFKLTWKKVFHILLPVSQITQFEYFFFLKRFYLVVFVLVILMRIVHLQTNKVHFICSLQQLVDIYWYI